MDNPFLWVILPALATGGCAAYLAKKRGYNPYLAFAVGILFGCLGLFAVFFFMKQKERNVPSETAPPLLTLQGPADKFWYYLDPHQVQQGPMSLEALRTAWRNGVIQPSTLVWNEDLPDWKQLNTFIQR